MSATTIDPQFAQLFQFTEEDLRHNQQGRLSERQFAKLKGSQRRDSGFVTVAVVVLLLGVTSPFWGPAVGIEITTEMNTSYLLFMGISLAMIVFFAAIWILQRRNASAAPSAEMMEVTRILDYMAVQGDEDAGYVLVTPGKRMTITQAQYRLLHKLKPAYYEVYYSQHFRAVVAILNVNQKAAAQQAIEALRGEYNLPASVPVRAAQLWNFRSEDLEANRNGALSEKQQKTLGREIRIGAKQKITDQPVQVLEGALYVERDEQNLLIAKVPKLWLRINGEGVQTLHRFIDLLADELESGETYRLYYLHDPYQNNNRPLSIERVETA